MNKEMFDFYTKFHLSTEGFYFMYRHDNNNKDIVRVTLYNTKNERVDDVRVTEGYGLPEKTHHDIIDYFEARITLKIIKTPTTNS